MDVARERRSEWHVYLPIVKAYAMRLRNVTVRYCPRAGAAIALVIMPPATLLSDAGLNRFPHGESSHVSGSHVGVSDVDVEQFLIQVKCSSLLKTEICLFSLEIKFTS